MENLTVIVFLILGITSFILFLKQKEILNDFVLYLMTISAVFLVTQNLSTESGVSKIENVLVCFISLNFIASRFGKISSFKFNWIIPTLLTALFLIVSNESFTYNLYDFSFRSIPILTLPVLGILAYPLSKLKSGFISRFLKLEDEDALTNIIGIFFIGIFAFIGSFFASNFGVFLIAIGFISQSFYRNGSSKNAGVALLFISLIHFFTQMVSLESVDLTLGKTVEGLFLGVFTVAFLHFLSKGKSKVAISLIMGMILSLFILFGLLLLSTQKSDFGGMDAFIASFVGIAVGIVLIPEFKFAEMVFCFVLSGALIFAPMTINKEEQELTKITLPNTENESTEEYDLFDIKGISLDVIEGIYKINEETAQITFQLGPKGGITKGAITSFSGEIEINRDLEKSKFEIQLPVKNLTTFNKGRDESIFEKEYFNLAEFPMMYFSSNRMEMKDDSYELDGDFMMLGVKKPLKILIKYVGEPEGSKVPVIIGKSSVDRTQFGMQPDSKEGNVVDFEFKIELIKK